MRHFRRLAAYFRRLRTRRNARWLRRMRRRLVLHEKPTADERDWLNMFRRSLKP